MIIVTLYTKLLNMTVKALKKQARRKRERSEELAELAAISLTESNVATEQAIELATRAVALEKLL